MDKPCLSEELLDELSLSTSAQVIRLIHDEKLDSWKQLLKSLSSKGRASHSQSELLRKVVKLLASRICSPNELENGGIATDSELDRKQVAILKVTCADHEFFDTVCRAISAWSLVRDSGSRRELQVFLDYICVLGREVLNKVPLMGKDALSTVICSALGALASTDLDKGTPWALKVLTELQQEIQQIDAQFVVMNPKKRGGGGGFTEEFELELHLASPPEDFREISVVPELEELVHDTSPFLRPIKMKGAYGDGQHYLDVQFRLLREDFVQPLRKGICEFLRNKEEHVTGKRNTRKKQYENIRVYTGLTFNRAEQTKDGGAHHLFNLPPGLRNANWDKSKRLLPGSLVMLTPNFCKTASFGTVLAPPHEPPKKGEQKGGDSRRREVAAGILRLSIEPGNFTNWDNNLRSYVMIECDAYFEGCRYNLEILQRMEFSMENPIMGKYLVQACNVVDVPQYFKCLEQVANNLDTDSSLSVGYKLPIKVKIECEEEGPESIISRFPKLRRTFPNIVKFACETVRVTKSNPDDWPKSNIQLKMGLDNNQYEAYKMALTSELAVIQGPPGTGKTFIGLQIVKTLLLNKKQGAHRMFGAADVGGKSVIPDSPILVVCYTNHALDQFLELILECVKGLRLVRLGGQSKSEALKNYNLFQLRSGRGISPLRSTSGKMAAETVEELRRLERFLKQQISTLRSEIRELSSPWGILNFQKLSIWRPLAKMLPSSLVAALNRPEWFGMTDVIFIVPFFKVSDLVNKWFDLRFSDETGDEGTSVHVNKSEARHTPAGSENKNCHSNIGDGDIGNEEYDMDELLEHRLIDNYYDDCLDDNEVWSTEQMPSQNFYLPKCCPLGCRQTVTRIRAEINSRQILINTLHKILFFDEENVSEAEWKELKKTMSRYKGYEDVEAHMEKLEEEVRDLESKMYEYENRAKLLAAIFDCRKRGLLLHSQNPRLLKPVKNEEKDVVVKYKFEEGEGVEDDKEVDDDDNEVDDYDDDEVDDDHDDESTAQMRMVNRWQVYFEVVEIAFNLATETLIETERKLCRAYKDLDEARQIVNGHILKEADIIGMTTTGAAKHHKLLEIARPQIVIVEEAAEILEAHVVTSLTTSCNHLVLIGDHFQLRPSINCFDLARYYHLNVSLFERMVQNEVSLCTLKTQHRMRPEIANLIVGPIYDELYNHESVENYPDVRGLTKNLFFISHIHQEETVTDLQSKTNKHEANFMVAFCNHLMKQGYKKEDITILTPYTGQMFLIKKLLPPMCHGVRVTCVDNYQGEENKIILLSLVRSNTERKLGFVGVDNRICVALSRAKHGLFVIGNMSNLTYRNPTWQAIRKKLKDGNHLGENLELVCSRHKTVTLVKSGADFDPLVKGGCSKMCNAKLKCAHLCQSICHTFDQEHEKYECTEKCDKRCEMDHPCRLECRQDCLCQEQVLRTLKCGHQVSRACYIDPKTILCPEKVTRELPCKHEISLNCFTKPETVKCPVVVTKELPCKHEITTECHKFSDSIQCMKKISKTLSCGHAQKMSCYEQTLPELCRKTVEVTFEKCCHKINVECWKFQFTDKESCRGQCKCEHILSCGHPCGKSCHADNDSENHQTHCMMKCRRVCVSGHKCLWKHHCYQKCRPCSKKVKKALPCNPEHYLVESCCEWEKTALKKLCAEKVFITLDCGHPISVECHQRLSPRDAVLKKLCAEKVLIALDCSHSTSVECHQRLSPPDEVLKKLCAEKVLITLDCGHSTSVECHQRLSPPEEVLKKLCAEKVLITLDCGHSTSVECHRRLSSRDGMLCEHCAVEKPDDQEEQSL